MVLVFVKVGHSTSRWVKKVVFLIAQSLVFVLACSNSILRWIFLKIIKNYSMIVSAKFIYSCGLVVVLAQLGVGSVMAFPPNFQCGILAFDVQVIS